MVHEVMQQKIRGILEGFNLRYPELFIKDLEEDAVCITPNGTFKGKEEILYYISWVFNRVSEIKAELSGIGIMAEGHKAVCEFTFSGVISAKPVNYLNFMAIETGEDDHIKEVRLVWDRLDMAIQAAGEENLRLIQPLVERMQEGLSR